MIRFFFLTTIIAFTTLYGQDEETSPLIQEDVPPEEIEQQLTEAQAELKVAEEMFNPYYAGPLLAGGANNVPPGQFNIQPYLFVTDTYAVYNSNRRSVSIPDLITINPVFVFQAGLISWMDFTISPQWLYNHQRGRDSVNWGDLKAGLGFQLAKETLSVPAFRLVVNETFPIGKYRHLDPDVNGVDATGAGSYQTQFGLNLQKVVFWIPLHPMRFRLNVNYTIPAPVHVTDFNSYGGGFGTRGKVKPGNSFQTDFAVEFSFTQHWVFSMDVLYVDTNRSRFSGTPGVDRDGNPASVGLPSSDQLSLAPAIQYNPNPNLGLLAGVWFTVRGRNSSDFISGILTFTYSF